MGLCEDRVPHDPMVNLVVIFSLRLAILGVYPIFRHLLASTVHLKLRWVCWCYAEEGRLSRCVQTSRWRATLWQQPGCTPLGWTLVCFWSSRQHRRGQVRWSFGGGKVPCVWEALWRCVELPQLWVQSHYGGLRTVHAVHERLLLHLGLKDEMGKLGLPKPGDARIKVVRLFLGVINMETHTSGYE